jgi:hypothetical protein
MDTYAKVGTASATNDEISKGKRFPFRPSDRFYGFLVPGFLSKIWFKIIFSPPDTNCLRNMIDDFKNNERIVESLQSHCIHTQFHWSSGPPVCFPS